LLVELVGQKRIWQSSEVVLENGGDTADVVEAEKKEEKRMVGSSRVEKRRR